MDGAQILLHLDEAGGIGHRGQVIQGVLEPLGLNDVDLILPGGIADGQTDHEAVQLRVGQGLGARRARGVLGGDAQERGIQLVGSGRPR